MTEQPKNLDRILAIELPMVVLLARKRMRLEEVLTLIPGTVLEFDKPVTDPLELLVNEQVIARGDTIKVGERFGLQVREIASPKETIRAMGAS